MPEDNPNSRIYLLTWNDNGAPYASQADHRTEFTLAEAMRIADRTPVTVTDAQTGRTLWIGSEATRSIR